MLNRLKKCEVDLAGSIFNADRRYDGDKNLSANIQYGNASKYQAENKYEE
jgi:hypothetical protein